MRSAVASLADEPEAGSVLPLVESLGIPLGTPKGSESLLQAYSDRRERKSAE